MDLHLLDVSKEFGDFSAVNGLSLEIASGELIALLGPSGSGKTTLLRLIAGLLPPSRGTIRFGGEDASRKSVQERNVGFVFQHYALFRHMTVLENVAFGLRIRPAATRPKGLEIKWRVRELLDLVQLPGLEQRFPVELSGGQRQRVALARALAIEPKVLLLDEPFGALDAKVRKELRRWLREIHDKTGHTTVFVTHDQEEALELADRVVVMNEGRLEQVATPDAIYDHPASPFVYSFIGESSWLPIEIQNEAILFKGSTLSIGARGFANGAARLFMRPHDVGPAGLEAGSITGRVVSLRRHQGMRRVELEAAGHRVEAEFGVDEPITIGSEVSVLPRRWRIFPGSD
jgi:sulfate transport system ATP-binding protein